VYVSSDVWPNRSLQPDEHHDEVAGIRTERERRSRLSGMAMRRRARPSVRFRRGTPGGSRVPSPAAHVRLPGNRADATQSAHRGGGTERRVLEPAAQPPPRSADRGHGELREG
jgi:hypothetical protein